MRVYRKRPKAVLAERLTEENYQELMGMVGDRVRYIEHEAYVETLRYHLQKVHIGDYIVKKYANYYVYEPGRFEFLYEPVQGYAEIAEMAMDGTLPPGFDDWELADDSGWTVAHAAALHGALPPGFDKWDLVDKNGVSVREVHEKRK
jgi:hypothetical protein